MSAETSDTTSDPPRAAIIANPVSGGGRGRKNAERAQGYLYNHGIDVEIFWTRESGDATQIAKKLLAEGVNKIAGCGGDGTLNELSNALVHTDGILGVIPAGRGNDLCRALNIPLNPIQAADIFLFGEVKEVDLGKIGDRYFNTIATLGFDAEVSSLVETGNTPFSGPATYLFALLKTLRDFESPHLTLKGDFGEVDGKIFLAATSNTPIYGGGIKITPPAKMDDGLLHICMIDDIPACRVLRLLPLVFSGKHISHSSVHILVTRQLVIQSQTETWVYADGERFSKTPLTIEVAPKALKVMTPLPLNKNHAQER